MRALATVAVLGVLIGALPPGARADFGFLGGWGSYGEAAGQFRGPHGLDVAADGTVYVADSYSQRIQAFAATGGFKSEWGDPEPDDGYGYFPWGVAVRPSGEVLVTGGDRKVFEFTPGGALVRTFGGPGELAGPTGLGVGPRGEVFVADRSANRVQVFSREGRLLRTLGEGVIAGPLDVAVDSAGNAYVIGRTFPRVNRFSPAGAYTGGWDAPDSFGIAIDRSGHLWVAQTGGPGFAKYTPDGTLLGTWGSRGKGAGQFENPFGVAADCHGQVLVTDLYLNRVQVFGEAGAAATPCPAVPPPVEPPPPPAPGEADRAPPRLSVSAPRLQRLGSGVLRLRVGCSEACRLNVTARGHVGRRVLRGRATRSLPLSAARRRVTVRLPRAMVRRLAAALRAGRRARVTLVVAATDAGERTAAAGRTVRLRR